ncbi:LysM peptidoglycan-binding domain-containing protein [Haloechinothrix sp. LS1_15]|uniref:LysM peptidoglycan-binding domain-containing protein n=1 Tax=Haloechinothrix sp. LS1_15 TaxID=2652248 RepID=UPI0029475CBF|nr:LysM peptidoglycan-binding domain-containing protein [Haloechinothrix sp. LS1_15]MDV6014487.1 LysM peptidoglycan-binding domain-containing protein [Haloechinothrix sp. LS1_15]
MRRPVAGVRGATERVLPRPVACRVPHQPGHGERGLMIAVVVVAICAIIVVVAVTFGGLAGVTMGEVPQRTTVVTVAEGESLWDIARTHAPASDPRAVIDRIRELNSTVGADAGAVEIGSVLTVPTHDGTSHGGQ